MSNCYQILLTIFSVDTLSERLLVFIGSEMQQMIAKVIDIIEIVNNVLLYNWSKISALVHLVDRIYYILQK